MDLLAEDSNVLSVVGRQGLLEQLEESNRRLEEIRKGLDQYVDEKRKAFPR